MLREPRTSLYVLSCAKRCQISKKSSWQRGRMLTKASPSASKGAEPQGCALQGARKGEVPAQQLGEPSLPQTLDAAKNGHRNLPGGLVRFCGSETQGRAAAVSQAAKNSSCPPGFARKNRRASSLSLLFSAPTSLPAALPFPAAPSHSDKVASPTQTDFNPNLEPGEGVSVVQSAAGLCREWQRCEQNGSSQHQMRKRGLRRGTGASWCFLVPLKPSFFCLNQNFAFL